MLYDGLASANNQLTNIIKLLYSYVDPIYSNQSVCSTGYSFRFSLRLNILSIQSFVPESAKGNVNGLLGRFDGDASNDLTTRDGELVCVLGYENCTIETIHTQFGETCKCDGIS